MVHLIFLLLASCCACVGALSHCLADSAAISHRGNRRARRLVVLEGPVFPSGTIVKRTASNLRSFRLFPLK